MTSVMEYSNQDTVDIYITQENDLELESETIQMSFVEGLNQDEPIAEEESFIKEETSIEETKAVKAPTVFVTELPKRVIAAHQELKIPSKFNESDCSEILLSKFESDGKGNSVVTIHVPYLDDINSSDANSEETLEIQISEKDKTTNELLKDSVKKNGDAFSNSSGRILVKPPSPQKIKQSVPIWKRHTPKPPGYISNYLYPHGLKSVRSRVIIDCPTNIPVPEFKAQLADTSDIVTTLDVAPSTKKRVKELTTNSVSKLFAYPGKPFPCKRLYALFQRHLTSKPQTHELPTDLELMPIGYSPTIDYTQVKRITRKRKQPEISPTEIEISHQDEEEEEEQTNTTTASVSDSNDIVQSMVPISDKVVRVLIKPGVVGEEEQEILVLHDGSETLEGSASLQHSIEVLLAAAESGGLDKEPQQVEQVFICNEGTYDENVTDPFMTEQIIIVQNDLQDDELCSETIESS